MAARRHRPERASRAPAVSAAGIRRRARHRRDVRQRHHLRLRRRHEGQHHLRDSRQGREYAVAAEGGDAGQHRLRKLHVAVSIAAEGGGAGLRGRDKESALRLRAVHAGQPARDSPRPAAEVRAGRARHLRQRRRLRDLQARVELHARHDLDGRSRRGSLGALHQRSRPRQHSERRHVLGRSRACAAA